jgi:hypothetical protein
MPWRKLVDCCVREIVKDDFAKVGAVLRHGACASLAKSNAMALPNAFKNDFPMALADNESVAGYGAPAKTLTDGLAPSMPLPSDPSSSKKLLAGIREPQEEP